MVDYTLFPSPCYVMEEELLRKNLGLIQTVARRAGVEIIVAFKAFAMWKSFPIFRQYVDHSTASSVYEARLAAEEFGSKAHTYSPAYTDEDFPELLRYSSHITFNSLTQYAPLLSAGKGPRRHLVRHSHQSRVLGSRDRTSTTPAPREPASVSQPTSCQPPSPRASKGSIATTTASRPPTSWNAPLQHIEEKFARWFPQLKWLNLGGGHLMTRKDYDTEHLVGLLKGLRERHPHLKLILEPGSAFTWQTGVLASQVVDLVENKGIRTAILNVSFTCHMPDCLEMPYQPAVRGAQMGNAGPYVYRLGGNSCLSGDYMGLWSFDHELQVGEQILFEDMIHYTMVKTTMFNGIQHPSIGMWTQDGKALVFRQFSYEDYRDRMC